MPDVVELRVKYKPSEELPASEGLWAEPVDAHERGGTYRLRNSSFMVPLGAGDLVRAEPAGDGVLQLVELVSPCGSILTVVAAPPGAELDLQPVVEAWSAGGALWTESKNGLLVTVWPQQLRLEAIESVIQPTLPLGLAWLATAFPSVRVAENMPEVDFELQRVCAAGGRVERERGRIGVRVAVLPRRRLDHFGLAAARLVGRLAESDCASEHAAVGADHDV